MAGIGCSKDGVLVPAVCFFLFSLLGLAGCASSDSGSRSGSGGATLGEACTIGDDCASGICIEAAPGRRVCSLACNQDSDCPQALNWFCDTPREVDFPVCRCVSDESFVLYAGIDNDCNGEVDRPLTADAGTIDPDGAAKPDAGVYPDAGSDAPVHDPCLAAGCDENATCDASSGKAVCRCNTGFEGDGTECTDIDGCAGDPCFPGVTCNDIPAPGLGYNCGDCPSGYQGNGTVCTDIDGCAANPCFPGVTCVDIPAPGLGYNCGDCPMGYDGDGESCTDIDGCAGDPCFPGVACNDIPAPGLGYNCGDCPSGYTGNGESCTDTDECANPEDNDCDPNAACQNTDGSYTCTCNQGWTGNGTSCTDLNECEDPQNNDCDINAACTNIPDGGGYSCECNPGWTGDGEACTDLNECDDPADNDCDPNATCTNIPDGGGFSCECNEGYLGNGKECEITQCTSLTLENGEVSCPDGADYDDTCFFSCNTGYELSGSSSRTCQSDGTWTGNEATCSNIDECTTGAHDCDENATCYDSEGSFTCVCNQGYEGSGKTCDDIDGCSENPCFPGVVCTDVPAPGEGYTCGDCPSGYQGDGETCTDVNECDDPADNDCDQNATCTNIPDGGGYSCQCNPGWAGDGEACTDLDECADPADNDCDPNAACTNIPDGGGYSCQCNPGWAGDGEACTDLDECIDPLDNDCDANATCTNITDGGGFSCACDQGWTGDGITCSDLDECTAVEYQNPMGVLELTSHADLVLPLGNFIYLVEGDLSQNGLFCGTDDSLLHIVSRSDPENPVLLGSVAVPDCIYDLDVSGDFAYLVNGGLIIVDISNASAPQQVDKIYPFVSPHCIDVVGDYAYAAGSLGFQVFDLSNPAAPVELGWSMMSPLDAVAIKVRGTEAYVATCDDDALYIMDIADPNAPDLIGGVILDGQLWDLWPEFDTVYVAGSSGIHVVDTTNQAFPVLVETAETPETAYALSLYGSGSGLLYAATGTAGIQIFDITDEHDPFLINTIDTPGEARDLAVYSGGKAYVADRFGGLQILDVSAANSPLLAANLATPGQVSGFVVDGGYAYLADQEGDLQIIDLAASSSASLVGALSLPGVALGITKTDDQAYLAMGDAGFQIVDVFDTSSPIAVGSVDTPGTANDVVAGQGYVFVADGASGIQIIDIADPQSPFIAAVFDTPGDARRVFLESETLYVADGGAGIVIIDVSIPAAPSEIGALPLGGVEANAIDVAGNTAFIAAGADGLQIVDITFPDTPAIIASRDTPGNARDIRVVDEYVYVADGDNGIQIISIRDPSFPRLTQSIATPGWISSIDQQEGIIYAGGFHFSSYRGLPYYCDRNSNCINSAGSFTCICKAGYEGDGVTCDDIDECADDLDNCDDLADCHNTDGNFFCECSSDTQYGDGTECYECSDYQAPQIVASIAPASSYGVIDVSVDSGLAYVVGSENPLTIFDVSDPTTPTLVGSLAGAGAGNIHYAAGYAYTLNGNDILSVIDVSDPAAPLTVGSVSFAPGDANEVFVQSDYAYVAAGDSGLKIVDITDPFSPTVIGTLPTEKEAKDVIVSGTDAFLAVSTDFTSGFGGLYVVDVSDPTTPTLQGSVQAGWIDAVHFDGTYAYAAGGYLDGDIFRIDVTDKQNPVIVDSAYTTGEPSAITSLGDYLFVTTRGNGFDIFEAPVGSPMTMLNTVGMPSEYSREIVLDGGYAYVANSRSLQIVDLASPLYPEFVPSPHVFARLDSVRNMGNNYNVIDYCLREDLLYVYQKVSYNTCHLTIFDVSEPRIATEVAVVEDLCESTVPHVTIYVSDGRLYIGNEVPELQVYDVSDPSAPTFITKFALTFEPTSLYVSEGFAFYLGNFDLWMWNVTDPWAPSVVTVYSVVPAYEAFFVRDDKVYFRDSNNDFSYQTLPAEAPSNPEEPRSPHSIYVADNYVYTTDLSPLKLSIIEMTGPSSYSMASEVTNMWGSRHVLVKGNYAYWSARSGLQVVDITDKANPEVVHTASIPGGLGGVVERNGVLFGNGTPFKAIHPFACNASVDECDTALNSCDVNASCTDVPSAGFTCECDTGYEGDGFTCTPVP